MTLNELRDRANIITRQTENYSAILSVCAGFVATYLFYSVAINARRPDIYTVYLIFSSMLLPFAVAMVVVWGLEQRKARAWAKYLQEDARETIRRQRRRSMRDAENSWSVYEYELFQARAKRNKHADAFARCQVLSDRRW